MTINDNHNTFSYFSTIVVFVLLGIIGMALIPRLNVSLVPSRSLPSITVRYNWYGASARIIESRVTTPLEAFFSSMKDIRRINSRTTKSSGRINISFNEDVDMDAVRFQVSSYIRQAYAKFPGPVSYPLLSVNTPNDEGATLLSYSIYGSASAWHIQEYAENNIKPSIANIKGVNRVSVYGATPFEWFVTYNPRLLATLDISTSDIRQAIREYFATENLGYAFMGEKKGETQESGQNLRIRLVTQKKTKTVWDAIAVKRTGNRIVYLTDIANVRYKERKPNNYYRINGLNTINFVVSPEQNVNSLELAKKVKAAMARAEANLPPSYSIRKMHDSTEFIKEELRKVGIRTVIALMVLLTFVLLISRRLKYLILITISLVVNLAIAVIFYYVSGLELHIYSLAGMTISLGIIIDNSIIMADHMRHQHNKKAFLSILAATLTTIGALSLVFFLGREQQLRLIDFSMIVIINLGVSLFVALFLIPSLLDKINLQPIRTRRFFRRKRRIVNLTGWYGRWIRFQVRYKWIFIVVLILAFGTPLYTLPEKIEKDTFWARFYNKTLGSSWYQNNLQGPAGKYLGGTLRLFTEFVYESSFYSQPERTKLYVRGDMPEGATIQQLNAAVMKMENYLSRFSEVDLYITRITGPQNASIQIFFNPGHEMGFFPFELKGRLIARANNLGGMDWRIYGVGRGFSNAVYTGRRDSRINLYGYNYDRLYDYAKILKAEVSRHERVKNPEITSGSRWSAAARHKIVVDLDPEYLTKRDFTPWLVYRTLKRETYQPGSIGRYFFRGQQQQVNLEASSSGFDQWSLSNMPLKQGERMIKLEKAGQVKRKKTGTDIHKNNQEYRLAVAFDFIGPYPLKKKVMEQFEEEANEGLPLGYRAQIHRYSYSRGDQGNQIFMIGLIMLIIFFICSILFESLSQPFVILSLVPAAFIGVFLTFFLFNINFDQGGFASFILLAGITVNAGLYIINEYNNIPRHAGSPLERYLKAFNHKIIPILLTISSTILGLVPFLLGGQNEAFWFAFAAGSIGGLVFSLVGLLVFLPVFFIKRRI
jgi:multidrug efflux pump subunit AcrB